VHVNAKLKRAHCLLLDKTLPHAYKHQTYNNESTLACPLVQMHMSNKHNLVLYIDQELVEKSRELGFNLSKTFENHLKQLSAQLSNGNSMNNSENSNIQGCWWAGPDLNRRPLARKANVLTKLDDRPSSI
jgi:hypothetical protein